MKGAGRPFGASEFNVHLLVLGSQSVRKNTDMSA